jgi:hypothetical protein
VKTAQWFCKPLPITVATEPPVELIAVELDGFGAIPGLRRETWATLTPRFANESFLPQLAAGKLATLGLTEERAVLSFALLAGCTNNLSSRPTQLGKVAQLH